VRGGLLQGQYRVDPVVDELQVDVLGRAYSDDEQGPARDGGPEERAQRASALRGRDQLPARAGSETAPVGLHPGDAGPPVRQVIGLGDERPDVGARREQLARGADDGHPSPSPSLTRRTSRSIRWRSAGETAIATTIAARPARAKATNGSRPTRRLARRETPFASTRISPTFNRVTKVDDMPARSRSRNSIRLKCVPTATISSAPFSYASSSATSSLIPGAATSFGSRPSCSRRAAPGAPPFGYA